MKEKCLKKVTERKNFSPFFFLFFSMRTQTFHATDSPNKPISLFKTRESTLIIMHGWRRHWECASTVSGDAPPCVPTLRPPAVASAVGPSCEPTASGGNRPEPKCNHLSCCDTFAASLPEGCVKIPRRQRKQIWQLACPRRPAANRNSGFMHKIIRASS